MSGARTALSVHVLPVHVLLVQAQAREMEMAQIAYYPTVVGVLMVLVAASMI